MISNMLTKIDDLVWGIPLIVLILAVGIFLTVRLRGVQFSKLGLAIKYIMQNDKSGKEGEVSSFGALCTALSATIGTGNIVGVATALVAGGPGALFWMWLAALFGTATKFAECMLAMKYRAVASAVARQDLCVLRCLRRPHGNRYLHTGKRHYQRSQQFL